MRPFVLCVSRYTLICASFLSLLLGEGTHASADIILETAVLGNLGQTTGVFFGELTPGEFTEVIGTRFFLNEQTEITRVEAHMGISSGDLFATISPITDSTSFPNVTYVTPINVSFASPSYGTGTRFGSFHPVSTGFGHGFTPRPLLDSGWYALTFHGNGDPLPDIGFFPTNSIPLGAPTFFRTDSKGSFMNVDLAGAWILISGTSVASDTTPIPEPSPLLLFSIGALGIIGITYRRKRAA